MKLLIVGLGSMGKRRARLVKSLGHQVVGVDSAPARQAEAAGLGIEVYPSVEDALGKAGPLGAGLVCTAPLAHAAIINKLLDAGLSVFTELNLVNDGYEEIIGKAKSKGITLFISNTMLYRAETTYITARVKSFDGPANYVYHIGQYLPDWHPWESYKDFFVGDTRTGGVREIFGIELPWLTQCFGDAMPVSVQKDKLSNLEIPYPDSWFVTLRHAGGAKGILAVDVVCPKAVRNLEVFGEGMHLFWEGNPASLFEYDAETQSKRCIDTYHNYEQDSRYSDNIVENAYLDELVNFFGVLAGTEAPRWTFEQDDKVIQLIENIEAFPG